MQINCTIRIDRRQVDVEQEDGELPTPGRVGGTSSLPSRRGPRDDRRYPPGRAQGRDYQTPPALIRTLEQVQLGCSGWHPLRPAGHSGAAVPGRHGALQGRRPISGGGCIRRRVPERVCGRRPLRSAQNSYSGWRRLRPAGACGAAVPERVCTLRAASEGALLPGAAARSNRPRSPKERVSARRAVRSAIGNSPLRSARNSATPRASARNGWPPDNRCRTAGTAAPRPGGPAVRPPGTRRTPWRQARAPSG